MGSKLAYVLLILVIIGAVAWGLVSFNNLAQTRSQLEVLQIEKEAAETNLEMANNSLVQIQEDLASTQQELTSAESELELYKDTYGSVVESGVQPPFVGADLVNYETANDPTWAQLLNFLRQDRTDSKSYVPGLYMCGDFATDVHNSAERAGIRAAYVAVEFGGTYHALNAFKTTDRGLVFIDCTGIEASQSGPSNCDKIVDVELGKRYVPKSLFPESGWSTTWRNMGIVGDVQIYW
jgi:hypothetical protein